MLLNIILLPLLTLIILGLLGNKIGYKGSFRLVMVNFLIILMLILNYMLEIFIDGNILTLNLNNKIDIIRTIPLEILIDKISIMMLLVVLSISLIVLLYTYDYMINDPHFIRFYSYIILFVFFMIIFLTSNNLSIIFIG